MYILFDIGGTKMRVAASRDCKELFGEPVVEKTPKNFEEGVDLFQKIAKEICRGEKVEMAGGGIAGPLDGERAKLLNSPNIAGWIGQPLKSRLEEALGAPVYIENDTAIVGLGEAHRGSGVGHSVVVYITVSTGVGGVRIVDGNIDRSVCGFEPGHQIIDADHSMCPECKSGQLEDMVSGTATAHRFGKKPYEIEDEHLWTVELPHWISYGLINTIVHWSPSVVVLGGSMIVGDPAISVPHIERCIHDNLTIFPTLPAIKKASCGDFGGIYGAMEFVGQHLKDQ